MNNNSKHRVLIVDDEIAIRRSMAAFLEDFDFIVVAVESAEEAMEIVEKESFNVGVIDLRLPGMTGDILIQKLKDKRPEMDFLIHTGSVDFQLTEELENLGLNKQSILLKPLRSLMVLVKRIQDMC